MLHEEQNYIWEIARELGVKPKIHHHGIPTISCREKLDLLTKDDRFVDWDINQIVKTLYFHRNSSPYVSVITPEFGKKVNLKDVLPQDLKIRGAGRYWVSPDHVPEGMAYGTCTPFPRTSNVGEGKEISEIIFIDHPPIRDKLVDISIGGTEKEMFETSMHLPYRAIYKILSKQFGDSVHII